MAKKEAKPVSVSLVLTIGCVVEAPSEKTYRRTRDDMIKELEDQGWSVNLESEEDDTE